MCVFYIIIIKTLYITFSFSITYIFLHIILDIIINEGVADHWAFVNSSFLKNIFFLLNITFYMLSSIVIFIIITIFSYKESSVFFL